jgi:hypothetical protein
MLLLRVGNFQRRAVSLLSWLLYILIFLVCESVIDANEKSYVVDYA